MSTSTATSPPAVSPHKGPAADDARVTFARTIRSEWVKFRSLRSTVWTLAVTLVLFLGIVTLFALIIASQLNSGNAENIDGTGSSFVFTIAASLASLPVIVLGVLVISGEYSTGMIRSTLVAVPKRLPALWAKAVVLAASIFVVSTLAVGISLGILQLFLGAKGFAPKLTEEGTARIITGVPLYLTAIALFAFAIGALLRHSAGALATVLGLLLVVENLFLIPWRPLQLVGPFLPGTAGSKILMPQVELDALSQGAVGAVLGPWQGYGVLLAWVAVLLATAALLLRRRDA
jgi:ABC-2 type transport system permease protein